MTTTQIQILIADDHQMFIDGLQSLLSIHEEFKIAAHAHNGNEVMEYLHKIPIHLILLDISMPRMNGIETMCAIKKDYPDVRVIIISMHNTHEHIAQAIHAGAHGYILKNTGKEELIKAIETVFGGESYFSREVTSVVFETMRTGNSIDKEAVISKRELDVIKLIAKEFTTKEIAKQLFISENTVETHRKNIYSKLNIKNTAGLIKYAVQHNLLT